MAYGRLVFNGLLFMGHVKKVNTAPELRWTMDSRARALLLPALLHLRQPPGPARARRPTGPSFSRSDPELRVGEARGARGVGGWQRGKQVAICHNPLRQSTGVSDWGFQSCALRLHIVYPRSLEPAMQMQMPELVVKPNPNLDTLHIHQLR